jgi:membrane protein
MFSGWVMLANAVNFLFGFALVTTVFAMIYKIMPRAKVAWQDVWIGAAVTAFLFSVGKFLIGIYIGKSGISSTFGAAGSLVVVLVWVYYSAQIFLMGAEFTWAYSHTFGSRKQKPLPRAAPEIPSQAVTTKPDDNLAQVKASAEHPENAIPPSS